MVSGDYFQGQFKTFNTNLNIYTCLLIVTKLILLLNLVSNYSIYYIKFQKFIFANFNYRTEFIKLISIYKKFYIIIITNPENHNSFYLFYMWRFIRCVYLISKNHNFYVIINSDY